MSRSAVRSIFLAAFVGAVLSVGALGGCSGGSSSAPSITRPNIINTPSPTAKLQIVPNTVTFPAGRPGSQTVTLVAPNPSQVDIGIIHDSCTTPQIASAQPSPEPSPSPSPSPAPNPVYVISSGAHDGHCAFMFKDYFTNTTGSLNVVNDSGGATPGPTPSGTPGPTPTPTPQGLEFRCPTGLCTGWTFTPSKPGTIQISVLYQDIPEDATESDDCGQKATLSYFSYGIYSVAPGPQNGTCTAQFVFASGSINATGTFTVDNEKNAARKR